MITEQHSWLSTNLGQKMDINIYGHFGFVLLLFPTISDSPNENYESGMIDSIAKYIEKGKLRVYSIGNTNFQSWLNPDKANEDKSLRHLEFNNYLIEEVVPFIFTESNGPVPIITTGAALGAYHAANSYFRRPDIFYGTIALSGTYNIEHFTKGYFDSNCYFNSPIHYLPNLHDPYWLSFLQSKHHVYLLSGSGRDEYPQNSQHLSQILSSKGISHFLDIWGNEFDHSFNSWNKMLPFILDNKL